VGLHYDAPGDGNEPHPPLEEFLADPAGTDSLIPNTYKWTYDYPDA